MSDPKKDINQNNQTIQQQMSYVQPYQIYAPVSYPPLNQNQYYGQPVYQSSNQLNANLIQIDQNIAKKSNRYTKKIRTLLIILLILMTLQIIGAYPTTMAWRIILESDRIQEKNGEFMVIFVIIWIISAIIYFKAKIVGIAALIKKSSGALTAFIVIFMIAFFLELMYDAIFFANMKLFIPGEKETFQQAVYTVQVMLMASSAVIRPLVAYQAFKIRNLLNKIKLNNIPVKVEVC